MHLGRLESHILIQHADLLERLESEGVTLPILPGDEDTPMIPPREDPGDSQSHRTPASRTPAPPSRVDKHPNPGIATEIDRMSLEGAEAYLSNPLDPFVDELEYKLARWFIDSQTPKSRINDFFNMGLSPFKEDPRGFFSSADGLWKKITKMDNSHLLEFKDISVDFGIPNVNPSPCFFRDPVKLLKYILKQPAYARNMVWDAVREFDEDGNRVYSELHTADWWWDEQVFERAPENRAHYKLTS